MPIELREIEAWDSDHEEPLGDFILRLATLYLEMTDEERRTAKVRFEAGEAVTGAFLIEVGDD